MMPVGFFFAGWLTLMFCAWAIVHVGSRGDER